MIKMIWAQEKNGGIGYKNNLPWFLPQEMRFFKSITHHQIVVMGYHTFCSIKKPLSERVNIVLSEHHFSRMEGFAFYKSAAQIIDTFSHSDLYIIGGKKTYQTFWNMANELIVSKINQSYVCDTYMPKELIGFAMFKKQENDGFCVEYYRRSGQ